MNNQDTERLLFLTLRNNKLSISSSALRERDKNRAEMIEILCRNLGFTEEQTETFYWDKIRETEGDDA